MKLQAITLNDLPNLYNIIFSSPSPLWTKYNAPYLNNFRYLDYETFLLTNHHSFYLSDKVKGIFIDNNIVGIVTCHWECFETRWLEVGIIIYDESYWSKNIGYNALNEWIKQCFEKYPEIVRVGLTTWSGNPAMCRLAEKLNLQLEGKLRKVLYYNNYYYDSLKYGILKEEFFNNKIN